MDEWMDGQRKVIRGVLETIKIRCLISDNYSQMYIYKIYQIQHNSEVQHVKKSPGFTLVVGLEVAFLLKTKKNLSLLTQPYGIRMRVYFPIAIAIKLNAKLGTLHFITDYKKLKLLRHQHWCRMILHIFNLNFFFVPPSLYPHSLSLNPL